MSLPADLVRRRRAAGLSQRALAERTGLAQPNIAAYERGRRVPSASTLARLDAVLGAPTLALVREHAEEVAAIAGRRRLDHVRVFGSVARGEATVDSDVDLLVHPRDDASIFDLAGFQAEVATLLGVHVDVVSDRGRGPTMARIVRDAVPLR